MSESPRKTASVLLLLSFSLITVGACQTFNISVNAPTKDQPSALDEAATLPPQWTITPSITPITIEGGFLPGEAWETPEFVDLREDYQFQIGEFVNFSKVVGDLLIVGDNSGMLTALDTFDPAHPKPMFNIDLGFEPRLQPVEPNDPFSSDIDFIGTQIRDVALERDRLYVLTSTKVLIFDVKDTSDPVFLGQFEQEPLMTAIDVEDSLVRTMTADYVQDRVRVTTLDAFDPDSIEILYEAALPQTRAARARMTGNLGYVTKRQMDTAEQLKLYDLEDPTLPFFLSEVFGAPAFRAWVEGDYAYISTGEVEADLVEGYQTKFPSIWVVDITDPEDPQSFSFIWAQELAIDLYLADELAYVIGGPYTAAFGDWGDTYWMDVADMSNPTEPLTFRTLEFPGQGLRITGIRDFVYVAAGQGGLQILRPATGEAVLVLEGNELDSGVLISVAEGIRRPGETSDISPTASSIPPETVSPINTPTPTPDMSLFLTRTPTWDPGMLLTGTPTPSGGFD